MGDPAAPAAAPTAAAPSSPPAPLARPAPLGFAPRASYQTRRLHLTKKLIGRAKGWAVTSPDGGSRLLVSTGRGARLFTPMHPEGVELNVGYVSRVRFATVGDLLGLIDEKGELVLFSLPDGRFYDTIHAVRDVAFVDGNTIVVRAKCRFERIDLRTARRTAVGVEACGDVELDARGRFALVYESGRYQYGANRTFKRITKIDLRNGDTSTVLEGSDDNPVMAPGLSPAGDRVCFIRGREDAWRFACQPWGKPPESFASNALRQYRFDETGSFVLLGTGPHRHQPKELALIELATSRTYPLFTTDQLFWAFWGPSRVVTWGKRGAEIYDLREGWRGFISRTGEWDGFRPLPGDRFILGQERGATRDLFELTLEASH